jgi:hypothetical protein
MALRGSPAGGGALSALWRQHHRDHQSNAEEGLRSSIFDGILTYVIRETRGSHFSYQVEAGGGDQRW